MQNMTEFSVGNIDKLSFKKYTNFIFIYLLWIGQNYTRLCDIIL
jgi:hypothetical protein